jgi:hypothetical protein
MICAENWTMIHEFGNAKLNWLREFRIENTKREKCCKPIAMCRNFYAHIIDKFAKVVKFLSAHFRIKKYIFVLPVS